MIPFFEVFPSYHPICPKAVSLLISFLHQSPSHWFVFRHLCSSSIILIPPQTSSNFGFLQYSACTFILMVLVILFFLVLSGLVRMGAWRVRWSLITLAWGNRKHGFKRIYSSCWGQLWRELCCPTMGLAKCTLKGGLCPENRGYED